MSARIQSPTSAGRPQRNTARVAVPAAMRRLQSGACEMSLGLYAIAALVLLTGAARAHGVAGGDALFIETTSGLKPGPWLYLGAKHMVTGYDHLLFLAGVVFYLYRLRDVMIYVTLFSLGHSLTLLVGVLGQLHMSAHLVDGVIGLSVVWKALDNLGAFRTLPYYNPRHAVFAFGLVHGFGLATKLQDFDLSPDGIVGNIVAFNIGVELGQILALAIILLVITFWRRLPAFAAQAVGANVVLMALGFALAFYQFAGLIFDQFAGLIFAGDPT